MSLVAMDSHVGKQQRPKPRKGHAPVADSVTTGSKGPQRAWKLSTDFVDAGGLITPESEAIRVFISADDTSIAEVEEIDADIEEILKYYNGSGASTGRALASWEVDNAVGKMLRQLIELKIPDPEEPDELPASDETVAALTKLLEGLNNVNRVHAEGAVCADGFGGADVTWRFGTRTLILAARRRPDNSPDVYLYERDDETPEAHEGKGYKAHRNFRCALLHDRLSWLVAAA